MDSNMIFSNCNTCLQSTKHFIKARYDRNNGDRIDSLINLNKKIPDDTIMFVNNYLVLECCGCETISFRKYEVLFKYVGDTLDENPEFKEYLKVDEIFPLVEKHSRPAKIILELPKEIEYIYKETMVAYNKKLNVLCASGLRTIVEQICNYEKVIGKNLKEKIENLNTTKRLSKETSESLQGLRFIGNEALHKLFMPIDDELTTSIEIIEHTLVELYEIPFKNNDLKKLLTNRSK